MGGAAGAEGAGWSHVGLQRHPAEGALQVVAPEWRAVRAEPAQAAGRDLRARKREREREREKERREREREK